MNAPPSRQGLLFVYQAGFRLSEIMIDSYGPTGKWQRV
jgi:hypothetical protein